MTICVGGVRTIDNYLAFATVTKVKVQPQHMHFNVLAIFRKLLCSIVDRAVFNRQMTDDPGNGFKYRNPTLPF